MVVYKRPPNAPMIRKKQYKKKKRTSDIVLQNWHIECHEEGSRLYKLTMALALEDDFNDLNVLSYPSNDGRLISHEVGN